MKFSSTIFVLCIFAVTSSIQGLSDEIKAKVKAEMAKCAEITGADSTIIERLRQGEDAPVDDKIKCFGSCLMKAIGLMEDDGNIDKELAKSLIKEHVSDHEVLSAVDACLDEKGPNDCETSYLIHQCLRQHKVDFRGPTE